MNSKRLNGDSKVSHALVQDTRTGEVYDVKTDSDFLFGRFLKSSIVIEELYISRSHSTIRYENDKFLLKDNNSCTGTYLNYKKISKEVILQNGDLIAFTDKSKTWDFVYKFCLLSNPTKKLRLEEENSTVEENDKFKFSIEQLENQVKELKIAKTNIINDFKAQMDELKKSVDNATELNNKTNNEMIKLRDHNRELNNDLTIYRRRCMYQKELLDTQIAKEEDSVETLKTQINKLLENDFQCAICNEVVFRPSIANCAHTFCEGCLKSWLSRSNHCPTCRSVVNSTTYSLSLDNYITNVCDLLGGTIKEQRLTLQSERNGHPPQVAKRGRKRAANQSSRGRREPPPTYELIDDNPTRNNSRFTNGSHNIIDIVDLTNNTSR
ncbi:E3 ubiquitin-protein ligase rnf8-A-like isoform X2 [Metopolophium dirhodum]|nr:E3 ubiquitin-protein ligase rnf8-A-like isoform X2 [Metopolophium dirhodum]XP_060871206.1 E3 ubiquitin-protein ligase rnf8-A-like isoform X2 [Metopolophium dirhodum]